ncbi:pyrimidine dimer DNA glycosylase/endonuclease V [Tessaracoccus aquimaris]|nr:pyrimidine dimer DNA glycosylase/endonuclease V [Tessaracoccus aquimaris]
MWSLHPSLLDRQGLIACWREALLAQAVLAGRTAGYRHHPQLTRFREAQDPMAAIGAYLMELADEATARGYRFDRTRIDGPLESAPIRVTTGQLRLERDHLAAKLRVRSPEWLPRLDASPTPHPLFVTVDGGPEPWERASGD